MAFIWPRLLNPTKFQGGPGAQSAIIVSEPVKSVIRL